MDTRRRQSASMRAWRRQQLDRMLAKPDALRQITTPAGGWIAELRSILGLRADQLAARLGVAQPTASAFERSEASGTITLNTLERVAQALGCRLVYAFVPEDSFEAIVAGRAERVASGMVAAVGHTMALEDQQPANEAQRAAIDDLKADLLRTLPRELWDGPG